MLSTCLKHRKQMGLPDCSGECLCPIDEQPIPLHVEKKYCPDGLFPAMSPPARAAAKLLKWTGLRKFSLKVGLWKPKTCNCAGRVETINHCWEKLIHTAGLIRRKLRMVK